MRRKKRRVGLQTGKALFPSRPQLPWLVKTSRRWKPLGRNSANNCSCSWGEMHPDRLLYAEVVRLRKEGKSSEPQLGGGWHKEGHVRWNRTVRHLCFWLSADAPLPEKEIPYPAEPARTGLPPGGPFHVCSPPAAPAVAPLSPGGLGKPDPLTILSRNATHPLLHISTLYEAREEEEGGSRAPPDMGDLLAIPPPQQILIATFEEPRTVVSTVEF